MATPLGHMLAGASVGAVCQTGAAPLWRVTAGALIGAAADLDFLPGILLGEPARFHHAASHSMLFVLAVAALAVSISAHARFRWGLLVGVGYGSHLVLDLFTFDDSVPYGIPLFWPFSSQTWQSPVPLLPNVLHSTGSVIGLHNLEVAVREVLTLGPILLITLLVAHRRRPQTTTPSP